MVQDHAIRSSPLVSVVFFLAKQDIQRRHCSQPSFVFFFFAKYFRPHHPIDIFTPLLSTTSCCIHQIIAPTFPISNTRLVLPLSLLARKTPQKWHQDASWTISPTAMEPLLHAHPLPLRTEQDAVESQESTQTRRSPTFSTSWPTRWPRLP